MRTCLAVTAVLAVGAALGYAPLRKWAAGHPNPYAQVDLGGKTVIVTGANTGIGVETAMQLYRQGANVVMACRSAKRCDGGKARIEAEVPSAPGTLETSLLDLNDMDSVRAFAARWGDRPLHILVNNAGIMALPEHTVSPTGVEMQMNVNHMGHFLLTGLLLPNLRASAPSRVVDVSSYAAHMGSLDVEDLSMNKAGYGPVTAYCASKLANVLHAQQLTKHMAAEGVDVTAYSLHPGAIMTGLQTPIISSQHWSVQAAYEWILAPIASAFFRTPAQGAQTTLYAATAPHLPVGADHTTAVPGGPVVPGAFYDNAALVPCDAPQASQPEVAAALWAKSQEVTGWTYTAPSAE